MADNDICLAGSIIGASSNKKAAGATAAQGEVNDLTNVLVISIISHMNNNDKKKVGSDERMTADVEANKAFGKRVKSRLLAVGMTSRELAELLNIKPQYMSQICTGKRSGIKYRRKIMEILKLDAA